MPKILGCDRSIVGMHEINETYIQETLSLYRPQYIYLQRAWVEDNKTIGEFIIPAYPFANPPALNYLTAPLALLLISQLGYVHTRLYSEGQLNNRVPRICSEKDFFKLRDDGRILISEVKQLRFTEKVSSGSLFTVEMWATRVFDTHSKCYSVIEFKGGSAVKGVLSVLVA